MFAEEQQKQMENIKILKFSELLSLSVRQVACRSYNHNMYKKKNNNIQMLFSSYHKRGSEDGVLVSTT